MSIRNSIKQLFCDHWFQINIVKDFISVGDASRGIDSVVIELYCTKCGKQMKIVDRQSSNIEWFSQDMGWNQTEKEGKL